MVNGRIVNVPSYEVKPDDVIAVRPKSRTLEVIEDNVQRRGRRFSWLDFDEDEMKGKLLHRPDRQDIPENIDEQLIVELYSK
jgi:small subunit ribosomal protein S4